MPFQKYKFFWQYVLFCNFMFHDIPSINAIVGNVRSARNNEFPFAAGIVRISDDFDPETDIICTAALITLRDIVSADHCFVGEFPHGMRIVIGSIDLLSDSNYYAAWWVSYDLWSQMKQTHNGCSVNDISVLRLTSYVQGIPYVQISYLPYITLKGKSVVALGWGEMVNGTFSTTLQTAKLKILPHSDCRTKAYALSGEYYHIDANILCSVGKPFSVFMGGDSGGPLLYDNKLVAINTGTCPLPEIRFHKDKLNMHSNIDFYDQYISDVTSFE